MDQIMILQVSQLTINQIQQIMRETVTEMVANMDVDIEVDMNVDTDVDTDVDTARILRHQLHEYVAT